MEKEYDFRGGKRGAVLKSPGKTRITIMLDDDVLEHFRSRAETKGTGYQTMINAALRSALSSDRRGSQSGPLTVETLRKIIRAELKAAGRG